MAWTCGCGSRLDLIDPVKQSADRFVVAGRGFGRELHGGSLKFGDLPLLPLDGHDHRIVDGFHYDCAQVLAAGRSSWALSTIPLSEAGVKWWVTWTYLIVASF